MPGVDRAQQGGGVPHPAQADSQGLRGMEAGVALAGREGVGGDIPGLTVAGELVERVGGMEEAGMEAGMEAWMAEGKGVEVGPGMVKVGGLVVNRGDGPERVGAVEPQGGVCPGHRGQETGVMGGGWLVPGMARVAQGMRGASIPPLVRRRGPPWI